MIKNEYYELIEKLVDKTNSGDVNWKSTADNQRFLVYFKDFSLSVDGGITPDDNDYVRITLWNDLGKQIDSFLLMENEKHWKLVNDLFQGARRKALKIDEALHLILDELNTTGVIGIDADFS